LGGVMRLSSLRKFNFSLVTQTTEMASAKTYAAKS
jgi:hypothetical protein